MGLDDLPSPRTELHDSREHSLAIDLLAGLCFDSKMERNRYYSGFRPEYYDIECINRVGQRLQQPIEVVRESLE